MPRIAVLLARVTLLSGLLAAGSAAAIDRSPTGVDVNSQGASTVFITFGGMKNQVAAEAFWCGALVPASPAIGLMCRPGTLYGQLPLRYDLSGQNAPSAFTDIMSIPSNVSRRAWEDAASGSTSTFFYVRRFVSTVGGPDEFVAVTCRLAGGGARSPLALLDVQLRFEGNNPVTSVVPEQGPPRLWADLVYNGTGRLRGRWEVVLPGDDLPTDQDLLPEGSLPVEQRPLQKRYSQVGTFDEFLPPTGKARLAGPDPSRLPKGVEGLYHVLLRIEASDDKDGDSDLAAAGAGTGVVHSGGLAGFPLPVLRYYVGTVPDLATADAGGAPSHLHPRPDALVDPSVPVTFSWNAATQASYYRLELRDAAKAVPLAAIVPAGTNSYRTPSWLKEKVAAGRLEWRVTALDADGSSLSDSGWRGFVFGAPAAPAKKTP